MPPKKKSASRSIPIDSLALRYSMDVACSIPALRKVAIAHVLEIVQQESGSTQEIAKRLGISRSSWWRWVQEVPELQAEHYAHRTESTHGRQPAALVAPKRRRRAVAAE